MATMIPDIGPVVNDSISAEPDIYWRLARQLGPEFIVIHSLPWVSTVAHEIDGRAVPTGELDFLILHPEYGVLALEIKGGVVAYHQSVFVLRNGTRIDPIRQVRRGTHALANWLFNAGGPSVKIGYAIVLPDSDIEGQLIPPALVDRKPDGPQNIVLDKNDLREFGQNIIKMMDFWKVALNNANPRKETIDNIQNLICPIADYRPKWRSRIREVTENWLVLTEQQQKFLAKLRERNISVLTGRSGTGKTLLATTFGREIAKSGKVLFLVFNAELAKQLRDDLQDTSISVMTFHRLCMIAANKLGESIPNPIPNEWFKNIASTFFKRALTERVLKNEYSALIIDEAQVFEEEWLQDLIAWFPRHHILACCDETQVFPYESLTPTNRIVDILCAGEAFTLTINLRSPKPVFERVQEVFPSMYEQDSRRPFEEDSLEELAVFNPLKTLYEIIRRLHEEKIDPKHITVVYIRSKPMFPSDFDEMLNQNLQEISTKYQGRPDYQQAVKRIRQQYNLYEWYHSQRDIEAFFGRVVSIGRFRGLESPIIIVYADGKLDHASLACAYTRTTTKCIVIYNVTSFFKDTELNILQRVVIRDVKAIQSEVEARWPLEKAMSLTPVISDPTTIYWSRVWGGWVFWEQWVTDSIATSLWRYHLTEFSSYPSYVINTLYEPWSVSGVDNANENTIVSYGLEWCEQCNSWTRWQTENDSEQYCIDCEVGYTTVIPQTEISELQRHGWLLTNSSASREERKILSPYLKALLYWNMLDYASKEMLISRLREGVSIYSYNPYRYLFRLLTGVDILRTNFGVIIRRDDLKEKYKRWFPDLQLNDSQLRDELTYGINTWIQQKLIKKASKYKSAEYIRIEEDEEVE